MADMVDRETGGYEAEFLLPVPEEYECPICQLAFRDPVQIEDCGHRFCQSCLQELKRRQGSPCLCPLDRKPISSSKIFVDKAAKRAVLSLGVKCANWKRKCDWTGDLIYVETLSPNLHPKRIISTINRLKNYSKNGSGNAIFQASFARNNNNNNNNDKRMCLIPNIWFRSSEHMKNCAYEDVHCTNVECNELMPRRTLQYHLVSKCRWRVVSCQFCSEMYTYKDSKVHMKVCKRIPLECVNKCGVREIPREEMSFHLTECPLAVHPCPYQDIGCVFKGKRDILEDHSKTAVHTHLSLALLKIRENESRSTCTNGVFIWKISNYKQQYELAVASPEDLAIFSPPFYTCQYGYKMRLKAYLQGRDRGKSTHLSLYIIIMKGDYDALLDWPFKQKITFYLIDQGEQKAHRTHQLSPNRSLPNIKVVFNRPTMKENLGIGNPCFVPHEMLESGEFIKDDAIFIKAVVEPSKATT